jgi:MYXO-CTERM domain-containing protein
MRALSFVLPLVAALPLLSAARAAHACAPPAPGLSWHLPADGATYPANGVLLFRGFDISLDQVTVKVDGQPASFVDASGEFPNPFIAQGKVRVSPKPNPGQMVVVSGDFCLPGSGCTPVTFSYTAGPEDNTPPDAPANLQYEVHDHPDFKSSGGDCQTDSDIAWWLRVEGQPAESAEAPVLYHVEGFADAGLSNPLFSSLTIASDPVQRLHYESLAPQLAGASPAEICLRVTTLDTAGNKKVSSVVMCKACHLRVDPQGESPFGPPDEPEWTSADLYSGGMCNVDPDPDGSGGSGGSGGNDGSGGSGGAGGGGEGGNQPEGGCSVSQDDAGMPAWAVLFGMSGLWAWARKRRARL